jgi:ABC-type nitrate/sulfonate/bicarbonate transport system substrate-binding protein
MTNNSTRQPFAERPVSRRQMLRGSAALGMGAGLAGLLAACGSSSTSSTKSSGSGASSSAGALTPVSLQFNYLKNVQFAGSYFAETKGYYKAAGLDVTLLAGGPSIAPEPIVLAGKALVGVSHTAEVISAIINGGDLKIIGATFQKNPTCIASLAKNPIKTPTDMYGKKIGISDTNTPIWTSFVKANDLDVSKIKVVTVGFDVTSLASGEIDGLMAFAPNEPAILKEKGVDTYVLLLSDFKYPLMEGLYIAKTSDLTDKKSTLAALLKAESQGWADVVADPAAAADLAVNNFGKDLKLDPVQQKLDVTAQNAFIADADTKTHGLFWMTDENIAGTISSLALGGVKATTDMFTNEILTEVYKGGSVPA